jgi:hypothetical protein
VNNSDALSRAKKALPAPKNGAVVPADRSGRNDVIARARAAVQRPAVNFAAPVKAVAPVEERKSTALIARVREAASKPVPVRPVVKIPDPPNAPAPAKAGVPVPVEAPAPVPATQIVPVEIAPGQTVPVEVSPHAASASAQPIVVNVNVVNEQRGWGPYWGPYWHASCARWGCPHRLGLVCTRWLCW